jgi:hypothetical protein
MAASPPRFHYDIPGTSHHQDNRFCMPKDGYHLEAAPVVRRFVEPIRPTQHLTAAYRERYTEFRIITRALVIARRKELDRGRDRRMQPQWEPRSLLGDARCRRKFWNRDADRL